MKLNGFNMRKLSIVFEEKLSVVKASKFVDFEWYPYGIMNNFIHLKDMFDLIPLNELISESDKILDIGAADGDLAFFIESLGYEVDIIDYAPTNFNNLRGAKKLKELLHSSSHIQEIDIDNQFVIEDQHYGLIFLLGILYHLKNPFFILEKLSRVSKYLVLSTRIAKYTPQGIYIKEEPLAYLLDKDEANNDSTNFWIFTEKSLLRIFDRSGWELRWINYVGDTNSSNPSDSSRDERAFALLRSKNF